jgi:hypothetical protein
MGGGRAVFEWRVHHSMEEVWLQRKENIEVNNLSKISPCVASVYTHLLTHTPKWEGTSVGAILKVHTLHCDGL